MNLGHVLQHGHQLPLAIVLLFPPKAEALAADGVGQMPEDRFDGPQLHAVDVAVED